MNRKWTRMYIQLAITLILTFIVSFGVAALIKDVTKVPRPCVGLKDCPTDYAFPSRHVLIAFALTTAFLFETKNRYLTILFTMISFGVAAQRLLVIAHTPIQVIAGAIIGVFVGYGVQRLYLFLRFYYNEEN